MSEKEKKKYSRPEVGKINLSPAYGSVCKTAAPTGGSNLGGSCDGTIGSPPAASPCSSIGS